MQRLASSVSGIFGRGRQQQGHRAFHFVVLGLLAPGVAVPAHAGDAQARLRSAAASARSWPPGPLFFGHAEDLVLAVPRAACSRAPGRSAADVCSTASSGMKPSVPSKQRGLAGGAAALDQHGQRPRQQAAGAGQVTEQLVGLFAHQAAGVVVLQDPLRPVVDLSAAPAPRLRSLVGHHRHFRFLPPAALANQLRLAALSRSSSTRPRSCLIAASSTYSSAAASLMNMLPLPGHVQVQRIDVHQLAATDHQVHLQPLAAELFLQPRTRQWRSSNVKVG